TEVLLVHPKLAFYPGEHLGVLAVSAVSRMRRSVEHIGRPAAYHLFADETEVKRLEHVAKKGPVFLVLAESRGLLVRRFVFQLVEIVVTLLLFFGGWKLPIVLQELLEASAIDDDYPRHVDTFRFHLPERVQPAILITLHICVMVAHRPATFGGQDGREHDLTGKIG